MPPDAVWDTPIAMLDLMVSHKTRQGGKSFKRGLLPHEQGAKDQGIALAKRLGKQKRE